MTGGSIVGPTKPGRPRLYSEFASWWHLLSAPEDYADEAAFFAKLLVSYASRRPERVLELGSGGGNNASFLKRHFQMTLSDVSADMLRVSESLNPECEHIQGDMRIIRLDRMFDAVFIHDAISYMTTEPDLRAAIETAFIHCRPGGVALFAPDYVTETFVASTKHGGHDDGIKGMRYLEWTWDPEPADTSYLVEFAYLLRREDGRVTCEFDRHECGLFPHALWLSALRDAGFDPHAVPFVGESSPASPTDVFVGIK